MICPKCKKEYPKDWKFCPDCSEQLVAIETYEKTNGTIPKKTLLYAIVAIIFAFALISFTGGNKAKDGVITSSDAFNAFSDINLKLNAAIPANKGVDNMRRGQLKDATGKQIDYDMVYSKDKVLKSATISVWLNGDNTAKNKDLIYISDFLKRIYHDLDNPTAFVQSAVDEAIKEKKSIYRNFKGYHAQFLYIVDAGGVKNENAILFGLEKD